MWTLVEVVEQSGNVGMSMSLLGGFELIYEPGGFVHWKQLSLPSCHMQVVSLWHARGSPPSREVGSSMKLLSHIYLSIYLFIYFLCLISKFWKILVGWKWGIIISQSVKSFAKIATNTNHNSSYWDRNILYYYTSEKLSL